MEWTSLNELRKKFLKFYESKGHTVLASAPLVPKDDNSLLLINSGMAPLKNYFMGITPPPNKRCTSCQKCIRTPDIERVGKTARHGTYFEMLGNFSFGDYFKNEATAWAWEFVTKELKLPVDRVWVTIYLDDDEAFEIWTKKVGVSPDRIVRLGREDNFWEIGSGPCGPCSELYFDRGEEYSCGKDTCAVGCDCDRYVEFWNLVFTQFNSDGEGNYTPLEHPNIDTGMGLERIACIMQGVDNLFEVDTVQKIMNHIAEIAGVEYKKDEKTDVSLRVITDHIRSTVFMIGDGVVPQNEGRGYVLRRLLRRAARHGRLLGIDEIFLYKVAKTVMEENKDAYPELLENADYIIKVIKTEEERFAKTIDQGMELLSKTLDTIDNFTIKGGNRVFSGEEAFKLYDTFGFPIDLIKEILSERDIEVDEEEFAAQMAEQRKRARAARAAMADTSWEGDVLGGVEDKTTFTGYSSLEENTEISAIVAGGQLADEIGEGDDAVLVLKTTPFYAESGGQVGDIGTISNNGSIFEVYDCKKSPTGHFMHIGKVTSGTFAKNQKVAAQVNRENRLAVERNHSAAHLLQAALRKVLGSHVHQAGSMVDANLCRFDFTHFSAMTPEEIKATEQKVNQLILAALPVKISEMALDEAKNAGAIALFGEKYAEKVRVVNMGSKAIELCGGTHVDNTSKLGLFKILKESSVAAGVRRIEAVTGSGVLELIDELNANVFAVAEAFKLGNLNEVAAKAQSVMQELKEKDARLEKLGQQIAEIQLISVAENAKQIGPVRLVYVVFNSANIESLRKMCDKAREQFPEMVVVMANIDNGKASIIASSGKLAIENGVHAGKLIKEVTALVGGTGGGRPESAMGGATEIFKIDEAFVQLPSMIQKMLINA